MQSSETISSLVTEVLGELAQEIRKENSAVLIYVDSGKIRDALTALRDNPASDFDVMSHMTAVDYSPREPRFEVVYELYSTSHRHRVRVKAALGHSGGEYDVPNIDSVSDIYLTANWHERECYDLMGINFAGHPDQRRILLPEGWDGYPLRKEYPYEGKREWKPGSSVDDGVKSDVNLGLEQG